jgi:hypothetical protein
MGYRDADTSVNRARTNVVRNTPWDMVSMESDDTGNALNPYNGVAIRGPLCSRNDFWKLAVKVHRYENSKFELKLKTRHSSRAFIFFRKQ